MKTFLFLLLSMVGVAAQVPTFKSFNPTQFSTNNFIISITNGALVTNINSISTLNLNGTNIVNLFAPLSGGSGFVVFTNTVWVSKNGNDGTGILSDLSRPYLTVQAAITAASSGYTIFVMPGSYDEQITLKDGVDLWLSEGTTLTYSNAANTSGIIDNGVAVNCVIDGFGKLTRTVATGSNANVLRLTGASTLKVRVQSVYVVDGGGTTEAVFVTNGNLKWTGDIYAPGSAMVVNGASANVEVTDSMLVSTNDYAFLKGRGIAVVRNCTAIGYGNSAFTVTSGSLPELLTIDNCYGLSTDLFGLEMSGGNCVVKNSTLESTKNVAVEGSAISKYGGELLILDDVQLICTASAAYSIESQNLTPHGTIELRGTCYANRAVDPSPEMNILFGELVVTTLGTAAISDVTSTGSATAFSLRSKSTLAAGDSLLSLTNNTALRFKVDAVSGYAGGGTLFLSDDGTYKAASGGSSPFTNVAGIVQYSPGQAVTNELRVVSGSADNATNVAFTVDTDNLWSASGSLLAKFSNAGTNRTRILADGTLVVGSVVAPYTGATLLSSRSASVDGFAYNEIYIDGDDGMNTSSIDIFVYPEDFDAAIDIYGASGGQASLSVTNSHPFLELLDEFAAQRTFLNPSVASSGSAVAYLFDTSNVLTNGDKVVSIKNSGVEVASVTGFGGVVIGANTRNYWGNVNPGEMFLQFNDTTLGDPNLFTLWMGAGNPASTNSTASIEGDATEAKLSLVHNRTGGLIDDVQIQATDMTPKISINVASVQRTYVAPGEASTGSAVAYLFDTSNTLTNGDKHTSFKLTGTEQSYVTPLGYFVSTKGSAYLAANATVSDATLVNLSLSTTVNAGKKYSFRCVLFVANSLAADGVKIDFDGGSATVTNFRAHTKITDAALLTSLQTSALGTDITAATVTGDAEIEINGSFEPSGSGTFIPRFACNADTTGTLTVYRGSNLIFTEIP